MDKEKHDTFFSDMLPIHGLMGLVSIGFWLWLFSLYYRAEIYLGYFPRPGHPDPKELPFFGENSMWVAFLFAISLYLWFPFTILILIFEGKSAWKWPNWTGFLGYGYFFIDKFTLQILPWVMD